MMSKPSSEICSARGGAGVAACGRATSPTGGQHGLAQSFFQVGGNIGSAMGSLLAAFIILPAGQRSIVWFATVAFAAILILMRVGVWYKSHSSAVRKPKTAASTSARKVGLTIAILIALIFSKYVYMASLTSYYTFYLIETFHLSVQGAQVYLFIFLGAVAAGTFIGGPIGDRIGRKYVIWGSILGVLPFSVVLPYANLFWTAVLSVIIGLVLASAFSAILVYAQELVPGRIGVISGTFFGLAFGIAGIGAAALGELADVTSIGYVYKLCSFLPAIGLLTAFLPDLRKRP